VSFERLEVRARGGRAGGPAAISIGGPGAASGRPSVIVTLSPTLATEAGFYGKAMYSIYLGKDEDAGKLRIATDPKGIIIGRQAPRNTAMLFNLGYLPAIGRVRCRKQYTDAKVVEPGVVHIDIPDFPDAAETGDDEEENDAAPAEPARKRQSSATETLNGVTIDLSQDDESVTFRGKLVEVTTRQARLIRLLARPRPAPVAETFLLKNLWDGRAPNNAAEQLRMLCLDLQKALAPIGLDLDWVKGAGYQLRDQ